MINFFHNIGVGIVSAFVAFVGVFHTQPTPIIQTLPVQVMATTTQTVSTSTKPGENTSVKNADTKTSVLVEKKVAPKSTQATQVTNTQKAILNSNIYIYKNLSEERGFFISLKDDVIAIEAKLVQGQIDKIDKLISYARGVQNGSQTIGQLIQIYQGMNDINKSYLAMFNSYVNAANKYIAAIEQEQVKVMKGSYSTEDYVKYMENDMLAWRNGLENLTKMSNDSYAEFKDIAKEHDNKLIEIGAKLSQDLNSSTRTSPSNTSCLYVNNGTGVSTINCNGN